MAREVFGRVASDHWLGSRFDVIENDRFYLGWRFNAKESWHVLIHDSNVICG